MVMRMISLITTPVRVALSKIKVELSWSIKF